MLLALSKRILVLTVFLVIIDVPDSRGSDVIPKSWLYNPNHPDAECLSMPTCETWRQFRRAYPWPYQTFALKENVDEVTVIISEPPPLLTREEILHFESAVR
jgi:hypothetical protein